jgi:hypothetical protein
MKKGLLIICAIAVVLGITSGALAGASAKQTSRLCVYVDHLDRGASYLDISTDPKYGHKTCIVGKQGEKGAKGATGAKGTAGATGAPGAKGATGPSGINSPLVYSFAGATGPDTGACSDSGSGAGWATDTFDSTYVVATQPDGSYVLTKVVKGTFITRAGVSQPNPIPPAVCDDVSSRQVGGVTGTFYGSMTVTVPANSGFDPFASCGAPCSPDTNPTETSANVAQNDAFVAAFFPTGVSGTLTGYDFTYDAGTNGHMEQNFNGATGNIMG